MDRRLPLAAALLLFASAAPAPAAGGKIVPGRCLAVVDGKTRLKGDCVIGLEAGGGFTMKRAFGDGEYHVVPDKAAGTAAATWWPDEQGNKILKFGPLERDGACWADENVRLCAWSREVEMLRNREASYTDFHTLIGKDVEAHCRMGECQYFRFESAKLIGHSAQEALFEIREHRWVIDHPDEDYARKGTRSGDGHYRLYARCSKARPAIMWRFKPGPWTIYDFAPGAELSVSGASEFINVEYAAACHARSGLLGTRAAVLLGYPADAAPSVADTQSAGDTDTTDKPEDALK